MKKEPQTRKNAPPAAVVKKANGAGAQQQAPKRDTDGDIAPNQRKRTHAEPDRASSQQPRTRRRKR
jgi:hypothetical protein